MTPYDTAVLAFYFAFMLAVSWVFRRFVRNVSDYFRGGGKALWWMVGGSAFMVTFSAWTFTGAASSAYADGWPIATIYLANALGFLCSALYFAPRFRQLRVVTSIEAIRQRFGRPSERVFTWLQIPLGTLQAGVWLNALGVFFSAVFNVDLTLMIVGTGLVVLCMALLSGSWGVLASDFIQVLILMPVCVAVTLLAIARVGGLHGFVAALPPSHLDFGRVFSQDFLGLWCLAMLLKQFTVANNMLDASRYLAVKDSRQARRAGFLGAGLFLFGVVIWFVPPMAARILFPDLHAQFPQLRNPGEAAFIAIAREVLPAGMLGLLVSGIFAATMSAMDAGLNKNAGIFVKNFYQPQFCPDGPDARLLRAGKLATLALGGIVISVALEMSRLRGLGLFLLMQRVSILIAAPIIVPLLLGLVVRNTPPWSAWSTVLVGFCGSLLIGRWAPPEWAARIFGHAGPLSPSAAEYWTQASGYLGNFVLGTTWFLGTKFFWRRTAPAYRADIETFFARLKTPVDFAREEGAQAANDERQLTVIGRLCAVYGLFVCLLALIPNPVSGRLAFLGCGGFALLVGGALLAGARQTRLVNAITKPGPAESPGGGVASFPVQSSPSFSQTQPAPGAAPSGPAVLLAVLTAEEVRDFFPEPLWAEVRQVTPGFRFLEARHLEAADFARELHATNPEVLVACWKTPPLPAVLPPRLRYVCYLAGSVKRLVTRAHLQQGLLLSNWGKSISHIVAEGALFHVLACLRRATQWTLAMHQAGAWKDETTLTASLFGRKVGLHGFGRVARELVKLLRPFNVELSAFAPDVTPEIEHEWGVRRAESLEALFADNDIVVEVAPLIPETLHVVREKHLRLLRPGSVFVNVGRADVVDEAALVKVAREGQVQFGLDVFSVEPLPAGHPLRGLPNVSLTPHLAGPTSDRRRDAGCWALHNLRAYAAGTPLAAEITLENYDRHT